MAKSKAPKSNKSKVVDDLVKDNRPALEVKSQLKAGLKPICCRCNNANENLIRRG